MTCSKHLRCDVAVIGGGPAGTTTAGILARRGITAIVVEASNYSHEFMGQMLSPALNPLLKELGIELDKNRATNTVCRGVDSSWGSRFLHRNEFCWTPYGDGWHVQRPTFDKTLASYAMAQGAQMLCNARVISCQSLSGPEWSLKIRSGNEEHNLHCKFIVRATGRTGNADLPHPGSPVVYDRLIGVGWIGKTRARYPYTVIEAVKNGWIFASPMPNGRLSVVLMTDSDIYRGKRGERFQFWRQHLRQAQNVREAFPESGESYPQQIFSAATILRIPASGKNWLSVGDAALSFDPLSGQGIVQAMACASRATKAIERYFRTGSVPRNYGAWIQRSLVQHLALRQRYYSIERRWDKSVFWQRRDILPSVNGGDSCRL
jgi:flavin-dependent dehydrogenase